LLVYGLLLLPTVRRQGISWDEQTDITIARAYLTQPEGWLVGSQIDLSQTRLPMAVVALVYTLLHTSDLITARLVSCLVGGLTLIAVYVYCRQRYDHARGLLAAGLLATSPFFLSFARVAFTETDIYLACTLAWLLVCVTRFEDHPTLSRAAWVGVMLGLSLSAKFTALAIFPVVWYAVAQSKSWSLGRRQCTTSLLYIVAFISGLAWLVFFVTPPEHLINPGILDSIAARFHHEMTFNPRFIIESVALHIFSIVFKSSPLIGVGLLLSPVIAVLGWRRRVIRFPALLVLCYFGGLLSLPLAQTFYTIPVLPILAVFTADQYLKLLSRRRLAAIGLATLALALLAVDLYRCYPDYNLNGYQWLGSRQIAGRASIGYRSVVQTPSDGVEQSIAWLNDHARFNERVLAYLLPWHIVQAVAPHPVYRLDNGFQGTLFSNPDYVVVEINAQIPQSWWTNASAGIVFRDPYDSDWLNANYIKVFSVPRAFGIEMASVWRKK